MHVEWIDATRNPAEIVTPEGFSDEWGNTVEHGRIGVYVGDGSGCAVLEGTREEIAAWLRHALEIVEA